MNESKKPPRNWRTRYPVESFDPRFRQVLLEGALREIMLTFPTAAKAKGFQTRLHTYRAQLKAAGDPDSAKFYRARTSRKDNILRIYPADSEFEDAFSQLDLSRESEDSPEEDILDQILSNKRKHDA